MTSTKSLCTSFGSIRLVWRKWQATPRLEGVTGANKNIKSDSITSKPRKRKKNRNKLENRKPVAIEELEHRMCSANSRTVQLDRFLDYLRIRYSVEERLYEFLYSNKLYRIYRMWSYNRKRKSESKLVKRIKDKFDPDGNGKQYHDWKALQEHEGRKIPSEKWQ